MLTIRLVLAATLAALAFAPVSASAQIQPTQDFGAFAYSPSKRVVASNIGVTKAAAQAAAELACQTQGGMKRECQAVAWFRNSSGAFALGSNDRWGWGWASSQATAVSNALHFCQTGGGTNCQVVKQERTASTAITSLAQGAAVTPLLGTWSVIGFTEGEGDHVGRDYWAIDFVSNNPAVYPIRPGRVVFSNWNCSVVNRSPQPVGVPYADRSCYGYIVVVDHGNGVSSLYAHLAEGGRRPVGTDVGVDDSIGTMSDSGCGTQCGIAHLHLAVRRTPELDPAHNSDSVLYVYPADPNGQGPDTDATSVRTPWHKT
jgi:murein DD-endopeptidase MepM/ murein hydrolase activator NlpD